ncbi:sulfurtransferase FdhD [Malaciobacter mytili]|uniref:Sulfur carrier protein FdhD n=1 Tax=Malaciobacter mytili LMG 24559 TaxID=1032238 RepID=A0AAX2AKD6_9BACT|nr:formate dehydrogenase accessory sulfurtransferase FdhD [Malaciobacter mytili]AXH14709.1 formate dehydrogenase accessory protein [Malaciobacter mytili LMG 24559]RXI48311.1 sulfurtransferase FdhD [Malaciobacter mytili]RXK16917.1 sulfurtransferase FdhD [Malaciobacter mytili LMG 24559]
MSNEKYLKKVIIDKISGNEAIEFDDVTIDESRLNLYLNGQKAISMMCIPKDQDAHAIGFLMSENVISNIDDIETLTVSEEGLRVDIKAKINEASLENLYKEKTLVSGCGGGVTGNVEGSVEIPFNQTSFQVKPETISTEVKKFYEESELYKLTGCVHKAMIYLLDGTTVTAEDIGRHNAIDKVVGKCKLNRLDTTKSVLFVSGRLSSEMVTKAVMHKIPIVVSRTAPTYLGVQTAQKHGVTLIGFARGKKMNLYTHQGRIDV